MRRYKDYRDPTKDHSARWFAVLMTVVAAFIILKTIGYV